MKVDCPLSSASTILLKKALGGAENARGRYILTLISSRKRAMTLMKALIAALVLSFSLSAEPINVSYTVSGGEGAWPLDFRVTNTLVVAPNQDFYFFGVDLSSTNITGIPASFSAYTDFN